MVGCWLIEGATSNTTRIQAIDSISSGCSILISPLCTTKFVEKRTRLTVKMCRNGEPQWKERYASPETDEHSGQRQEAEGLPINRLLGNRAKHRASGIS